MTELVSPHSLDAERSVLGAILVHNPALQELGVLRPEHFFRKEHQDIFRAILALDAKGSPVDFRLLHEELIRTGLSEETGGPAYVAGLADGVPRSTNVRHYGQVVLEHALRRALIAEAERLTKLALLAEAPARELLTQHESRLMTLDQRADGAIDAVSAEQMTAELFPVLEKLWAEGGRRGIRCGLDALDDMTRGFKAGELVVVGARPSMGKTAFCLQVAMAAAATVPVLFLSLEMQRLELGMRGVSMLSGYEGRIIAGDIRPTPGAQQKIGVAMAEWARLNLHIDHQAGITAAQVRSKARRFRVRQKGVGLIVVDYLQLLRSDRSAKHDNRNLELGEMTRTLKEVAKELECPVMLLSQLNRNLESRQEKRPGLADLRESGSIEQDADVVLLLHRPHYYDQTQDPTYAEVLIAKQRNGPTGLVPVTWNAPLTQFNNRLSLENTA